MKRLKDIGYNILIVGIPLLWIFMAKISSPDNIVEYILMKISELAGKGFLMWLISGWLLRKCKNTIIGAVIVIFIGIGVTLIPQYIDALFWSLGMSLPLDARISIANHIFMEKFIGDYIWRTIFWPLYYLAIYVIHFLWNTKKWGDTIENTIMDKLNLMYEEDVVTVTNKFVRFAEGVIPDGPVTIEKDEEGNVTICPIDEGEKTHEEQIMIINSRIYLDEKVSEIMDYEWYKLTINDGKYYLTWREMYED